MVLAGMIGNPSFSTFTAIMLIKAIEVISLLTATSALYMLSLKVRARILKRKSQGGSHDRYFI